MNEEITFRSSPLLILRIFVFPFDQVQHHLISVKDTWNDNQAEEIRHQQAGGFFCPEDCQHYCADEQNTDCNETEYRQRALKPFHHNSPLSLCRTILKTELRFLFFCKRFPGLVKRFQFPGDFFFFLV